MRTKAWFKNRIGKRIYRDANTCKCKDCADVVKGGIIVENEQHAEYIYDTQCEFYHDGVDLNYRDKL